MQGKYKNKTYPLRIDENTLNRVKYIADKEGRSANKQIEQILQEWIASHPDTKSEGGKYV